MLHRAGLRVRIGVIGAPVVYPLDPTLRWRRWSSYASRQPGAWAQKRRRNPCVLPCRSTCATFFSRVLACSAPSRHLLPSPMPINVVAAVVQESGRFLVCRRPSHKRHGGLWEFPGGKLDPAETIEDAVVREIREELATAVTSVGPVIFSRRDPGSDFLIQFVEVRLDGAPTALEHDELAWGTPEELLQFHPAPSDRAFVLEHLTQE